MTTVLEYLRNRGVVHDVSHPEELDPLLTSGSLTFYCGFDPTASSLHVGSMLPLIMMRRLQERGHKPIVVLGSSTGMIGDPSGKSEERKLLTPELVQENLEGMREQIKLFLRFDGANGCEIVENGSWTNEVTLIDFLRDIGKHFSVNMMMAKESVKSRLENRDQGISFTEFSYMLLQAFDFYWLSREKGCALQVGGSDQWGNITAGIDLIHRKLPNNKAFGLTFPLLKTASGTKFGKTEHGTVWLDKSRTSPFRFYQFWLNTNDSDIGNYLRIFTDLADDEIAALLQSPSEKRAPQRALARTLTTLVHGEEATEKAIRASEVLFGAKVTGIDTSTLLEIFQDVPSVTLSRGELTTVTDLLVQLKAAESKSSARRLVESGGVSLNDERPTSFSHPITAESFIEEKVLVVRCGKKNYFLVLLKG